jgi:hypothetical protein
VTAALAIAGALSALLLIRGKAPAPSEQQVRTGGAASLTGEQAVTDRGSPVRSV